MGYSLTTGALQLPYPDGAEDLDIPGDMQLLAQTIDDNVSTIIGDNVVLSAEVFVTATPPTPNVEVINSKMNIYLEPPDLSSKLDSAGGTITGNLQINGDLTFGPVGGVSVPTPAAALDPVTLAYLERQMFGEIRSFAIPAEDLEPGWYVCDGSAHGNATLAAAIGPNTPDLRGRGLLGATGETGQYPRGSVAGTATVTLAETNMPNHTHVINSGNATHGHTITVAAGGGSKTPSGSISNSSVEHTHSGTSGSNSVGHTHTIDPPYTNTGTVSADHSHGFTTGWMNQNNPHTHDAYTKEGLTTGDSDTWIDTADNDGSGNLRWNTVEVTATDINHTHSGQTGGMSANHYHGVDIAAFTSAGQSANHTHSFTTGNMSANASHGHTFTGSSLNIDHGHAGSTASTETASHTHTAAATGSGTAFSIIQPSYAVIYAIFGGTVI